MTDFNNELIEKAKQAKSAEELIALAKANGMEMTEEQANAYFAQLHPVSGEITDDELENVAGGGCATGDGRLVVTVNYKCEEFVCKNCGNHPDCIYEVTVTLAGGDEANICKCEKCGGYLNCANCKYCTYEKGLWLCNNEKNRK